MTDDTIAGDDTAASTCTAAAGDPRSAQDNSVCAQCGTGFACGTVAGASSCWCAALPLLMPVPAGAAGCLCPQCLRAALAGTDQADAVAK